MSGASGPTVADQTPCSSFCMAAGDGCPSMASSTFCALGAGKRKITRPSLSTSGGTGRAGRSANAERATTAHKPKKNTFAMIPPSPGARSGSTRRFEQQVDCDEDEKDYRDHPVHGKEGGVQAGQIMFRDQGVLIDEQQQYGGDAQDGEGSQIECPEQGGE